MGAGVREFCFTINPNLNNVFGGGWGGGVAAGGARILSDFFHKESKSKKKTFLFGCGGDGGWRGGGRWMDSRTGPNQFALQLRRSLGHNNALMYKLCP